MTSSNPIELLCLGEPLVEFNQQFDGRFLKGFGGDVSNVAISAARQNANAGLLSKIGADPFGHDLQALWKDEGVSHDHVLIDEGGETGLYFVTHDTQRHHFTYRRAHAAARNFGPGDLPIAALSQAKMFYASGISLAVSAYMGAAVEEAAKITKSGGGLFAFDPNLRTKLWPLEEARHTTHAVMELCDIALPSLEDAIQLTGYNDPELIVAFYHNLGAVEVVLTMGSHGVLLSDGSSVSRIPKIAVEAADATGAGDCFNGAYLAQRLRGSPAFEAAEWANVAAALSTQGFGAVAPIPTFSQTLNHIEKTGEYHVH
ncbi:MAG: sugar kinase [Pseudomonadota bacterium]